MFDLVLIKSIARYCRKAIDKLCVEYGFEGVKHDFGSYPFEDSENLLKNKMASGYEYRKWWMQLIRAGIPKDGYFKTGCDLVMANPFLGEYFTNYRYGIDIAEGNWENVKTNFLWGTACFATHTGDMFVPNSDSVGMLPGLKDVDAAFWINYCLVTRSAVEIAGKFSEEDITSNRFKMLQKAVCCPNNGQDICFANYNYRTKEYSVPETIYIKTPHFSTESTRKGLPLVTVGIFNLQETDSSTTLSPSDLDLNDATYIFTDVWTGEQFKCRSNLTIKLPPHGSRLFSVNKDNGIQLFDANIKLSDFTLLQNFVECQTYYKADAEMTLSILPTRIEFNGEEIEYKADKNKVLFQVPGKGELKLNF